MSLPEQPPAAPRANVVPHLIWEAVLLLAAVAVTILAVTNGHFLDARNPLWQQLGLTGFVASGFALSLRAGTPNLAVGSAALLAGTVYAKAGVSGWPAPAAAAVAVLAATGLGLFLAVIAGLTGLPAWSVSLVGLPIGFTVTLALTNGSTIAVRDATISRGPLEALTVLFVLTSVAGALLWLVPGVRSIRFTAQPGGAAPGAGQRMAAALVGLAGSSLLAGLAGALTTGYLRTSSPAGTDQFDLLVAVAAVLLGGASITRRSFGIAGTVLAVYLFLVVENQLIIHNNPVWKAEYLPVSVAIVVGLLAGWLLDLLGNLFRATPSYPVPPGAGPMVPPPYAVTPQQPAAPG
ncbi:MAG: hypothetical protein J2P15_01415 [Micromonosporaceae bacterium]|nr:hypothetical protein [Micromonosporaceae bacterium]